jgi:hypothetical protein
VIYTGRQNVSPTVCHVQWALLGTLTPNGVPDTNWEDTSSSDEDSPQKFAANMSEHSGPENPFVQDSMMDPNFTFGPLHN